MKMNFSKDELAMVYQYAAGTKEETCGAERNRAGYP